MTKAIEHFEKQYAFLSNFYTDARGFCVEVLYQAAKACTPDEYAYVLNSHSAAESKRRGRKVSIVPDWDNIKLSVMERLLREKFKNIHLSNALLATGDAELVEGNWWGDTYWGVCNGVGENHLGKLLMKIRSEINGDTESTKEN